MPKNRFKGILVYDDDFDIFARNGEGRILFRYNKIDESLAFFRCPRMTDAEKEFCFLMFDKFDSPKNPMTKVELEQALNYSIDRDLYCT